MSKKSKSKWVLLRVPPWLAAEWEDDAKYADGSTLGFLEGGLAEMNNLRKDMTDKEVKNLPPTRLIVNKGAQLKLDCPSTLAVNRPPRKIRRRFKHGQYLNENMKHTQLIFETSHLFPIGSTVLAAPNFEDTWEEGIVKGHTSDGKVRVKFESGNIETRSRDQLRLPEESQIEARKCKALGMVLSYLHVTPEMNREYAEWMKRKVKKRGVKRARTEKQMMTGRMDRINKYINKVTVKAPPKKKKRGPKRVKEKPEIYRDMILSAFDSDRYLDKTQLQELTGEPWTFLSKQVAELCDRVQNGGEFHNHYELKEEYRVGDPNSAS